jgi:NAD(P)-dependent dehydrogenase (short-subunit alcohol dehydrogenase family)
MTAQIALVTGANRGIGFEVCRQLARRGIHVILTSRDAEKGQHAADVLRGEGLEVSFHPLDVTDHASVQAIHAYVQRQFGRLDILVNNAGVYPDEGVSVLDLSPNLLKATFDVNTFGPFMLCQAFVPMMLQNGYGRVVNVTSGYGSIHEMNGYIAAYKMSKAALNALGRAERAAQHGAGR